MFKSSNPSPRIWNCGSIAGVLKKRQETVSGRRQTGSRYVLPGDNTAVSKRTEAASKRQQPAGPALTIAVVAWVALVGGGIYTLWQYEHTAGIVQEPPARWPAASQLMASADRYTLLLFAHPKCPCTRASIGELERIMTHCRNKVRAYVVFIKPKEHGSASDWEKTVLWKSAERIPGVTAVADIDGVEATMFKAETSGFVVVYRNDGRLTFRGGITVSRGHSGDNTGRTAIVDLLLKGSTNVESAKVYGCELGDDLQRTDQQCCRR